MYKSSMNMNCNNKDLHETQNLTIADRRKKVILFSIISGASVLIFPLFM